MPFLCACRIARFMVCKYRAQCSPRLMFTIFAQLSQPQRIPSGHATLWWGGETWELRLTTLTFLQEIGEFRLQSQRVCKSDVINCAIIHGRLSLRQRLKPPVAIKSNEVTLRVRLAKSMK